MMQPPGMSATPGGFPAPGMPPYSTSSSGMPGQAMPGAPSSAYSGMVPSSQSMQHPGMSLAPNGMPAAHPSMPQSTPNYSHSGMTGPTYSSSSSDIPGAANPVPSSGYHPGMPNPQTNMPHPGLPNAPSNNMQHPGMPSAPSNMPHPGMQKVPGSASHPGMPNPNMPHPGIPSASNPSGMPGAPSSMQHPGMPSPSQNTLAQNYQQPGMPGAPNMQAPGMPQPGMPGGMSQYGTSPGSVPSSISHPGMPGMPSSSGIPGGFPGMPGAPGGIPNGPPQMMPPGVPGMPPGGAPGMPGGYGGYPGIPGAPPGMPNAWDQSAAPRRLDPQALPSAVQVIDDDRQTRSGTFHTGYPNAEQPPLVSTDFAAVDNGNSNPKFIRSSFYAVPATNDHIKQSQLPFSLNLTPFAKLSPNEYNPPIVQLPEGPVRCHRCKAYISPFMEFIDGGRKFKCPFCHTSTAVEETYFAHLDHTGRRTDLQHRPELYLGSYELVATKLYCKNGVPPKQPAFIFFLDVSYNSVRSGLVNLFCNNFPNILKNLPKDYGQDKSSMKIGFATYDQTLHFYNLSHPNRAEMLIANDVSDVFVPFVEGFLVDVNQAEEAIRTCLEQVKACFAETRITETVLGPVIQAGMDALRSADIAGKIFVFHTSLPTFEAPGKLKNREDRKVLGTDRQKAQLTPGLDFYTKLGEECIKIGCAVDLFLFPNSYVDLPSIAPVSNISGGTVYKYQFFDAERDAARFLADLQHDVSRNIAFDVMMRVRTSTGIRPTGFFGDFYMQNTTDIEVGALDADKGMIIECKYDDKLDEKIPAVFQAAVLFTSCSGQRRLRIHNLSLSVTNDYNVIYRFVDQDTVVTHLLKVAAKLIKDKAPKEMREELFKQCAAILATYREKCSQQSPHTQLVLPENLKLLPLYLNCIVRTDGINGGSELTVDDRAWLLQAIPSLRIDVAMRLLYPQVLPISKLELAEGTNDLQLPTPIRASYDFLDPTEVYFIENSVVAFIWVGPGVPADYISDVFNVQSLQHLDTESHHLPERDNARSRALRKLINDTNADRPLRLKLFIIKQQDSLESWMKKFLVEDKYASNSDSYVDFLCQLHREIRTLLS